METPHAVKCKLQNCHTGTCPDPPAYFWNYEMCISHYHRRLGRIGLGFIPVSQGLGYCQTTVRMAHKKSGKTGKMSQPSGQAGIKSHQFSSVQFSRSVMTDSLWPHEPQHIRSPSPSPTPGVHPNPYSLSWWCHPTISSSVIPFSSCPQSFPASGSFQISQFFTSGGQSIGVSASTSVFPVNTQDWSPLGWTGWISLQSKGLSRVFSNTTVQKYQFFCAQLSL